MKGCETPIGHLIRDWTVIRTDGKTLHGMDFVAKMYLIGFLDHKRYFPIFIRVSLIGLHGKELNSMESFYMELFLIENKEGVRGMKFGFHGKREIYGTRVCIMENDPLES